MDFKAVAAGMQAAVKAEIPTMHIPGGPLVMPTPPAFVIYDFNITPHGSMGFLSEADVTSRVVVSRADSEQSVLDVESLLSDGVGSIFYALMKPVILGTAAAQTFGGSCSSAAIRRISGYRQFNYASGAFVGFEVVTHVIGERSA